MTVFFVLCRSERVVPLTPVELPRTDMLSNEAEVCFEKFARQFF